MVVVPSRQQTPWWPVLAGWAAGRPVVATHPAAPGLMEHEQTGVLCYPSENSLVWGVERVLFDADLRSGMAEKGRDKLEEGFGWNRVAEQVQELMGATARLRVSSSLSASECLSNSRSSKLLATDTPP